MPQDVVGHGHAVHESAVPAFPIAQVELLSFLQDGTVPAGGGGVKDGDLFGELTGMFDLADDPLPLPLIVDFVGNVPGNIP